MPTIPLSNVRSCEYSFAELSADGFEHLKITIDNIYDKYNLQKLYCLLYVKIVCKQLIFETTMFYNLKSIMGLVRMSVCTLANCLFVV